MLTLAENLRLPVDAATQTFLVVGKRGSGKSTTCVRLAEQFFAARIPFVVLDVVDTWWGLKASKDGKGPGLGVYVFGGRHADLPLEPTAGALMADVLLEHRMSAVLSIKHFSGRERTRFVSDFADRLYHRNTLPMHVFLEEAHEVAPQQPYKGEEEMLGRVTRIWKLGRASGLGGSAITQRPASLSKNITTQAEILIVHRTLGPQDVAAVREWIKYHGEREDILAQLSTLKTGEAFVWAPDFPEGHPIGLKRVQMLDRETFDSSATPKTGQKVAEPKTLADVDLQQLQKRMAATIEKARADDPKELRKQLIEVKRQLAQKEATLADVDIRTKRIDEKLQTVAHTKRDVDRAGKVAELKAELVKHRRALEEAVKILIKVKVVDFPARGGAALEEAVTAAVKQITSGIEKRVSGLAERVQGIQAAAAAAEAAIQKLLEEKIDLSVTVQKQTPFTVTAHTAPRHVLPSAAVAAGIEGAVSPAKQKILNGLAFLHGIGVAPADKTQLALIVGVSPTSGGYFNNLGALRSDGLIDYPSAGAVALTDAGAKSARTDGVPSTTNELHEAIRAKLPPAKWKIVEALIDAYPNPIPKDTLAEQIGVSPTSGGFFNNLGSLRSLGLIDYPQPGTAAAQPVLFLEG